MLMNSLFWNIRGVRGDDKKGFLRTLTAAHHLQAIILLEPMVAKDQAQDFANSLGFSNVVVGEGDPAQIWILWKGNYQLDIIAIHQQSVTV